MADAKEREIHSLGMPSEKQMPKESAEIMSNRQMFITCTLQKNTLPLLVHQMMRPNCRAKYIAGIEKAKMETSK